MAQAAMRLVEDPGGLRAALPPLRRLILDRLQEPSSATELAVALGIPRQRVNYHVRALEHAGLVELVEERQRRGCVERIMRATARAFLVDPAVLGSTSPDAHAGLAGRDRFAAEHLMSTATQTVRDVGRMLASASQQRKRLLTFTVETELWFAEPADVHAFTADLADAVGRVAKQHSTQGEGRRYRVVVGGYPAPHSSDRKSGSTRGVTS